MNTRNSWLRSAAVVAAGIVMTVLVISPDAYSKPKKKKAAVEPTATLTPTPTPTPEVHMRNFDSDKAGEAPAGWKALEGDWQEIPDPSAPSKPNTFGLPAGLLLKTLTKGLDNHPTSIRPS